MATKKGKPEKELIESRVGLTFQKAGLFFQYYFTDKAESGKEVITPENRFYEIVKAKPKEDGLCLNTYAHNEEGEPILKEAGVTFGFKISEFVKLYNRGCIIFEKQLPKEGFNGFFRKRKM